MIARISAIIGALLLAAGLTLGLAVSGAHAATVPSAKLGTWTSAEDSGSYSTVAGQKPDIANYYLAWGQAFPVQFFKTAVADGATPFIEIEPWHEGETWDHTPPLPDIAANGDSSDAGCSENGTAYGTKCSVWLAYIGQQAKALGVPVIWTFAHEFNVSGQYPWSQGDTGSCNTTPCTPKQWVAAWDEVESLVNAGSGPGNSNYWMWAPNADTGGSTESPVAWWPGASEVQMVGVDGYPDTEYGSQFGSFAGEFGPVFAEIRNLGYEGGIFISETDLAPLGTAGYQTIPQFISALLAAGGTGVLQFQDGTAALSASQWSQLDTALSATPPVLDDPVLSGGHATAVAPTREDVTWTSSVYPGTWDLVINGPGPINGHTAVVTKTEADYAGLESGHTYTVTIRQVEDGQAVGSPGTVTFKTER